KELEAMPTVLDGGSEADLDPVLSQRRDLANHLRLGELLADRDHHEAALVEYDKAHDTEDPTSPLLANRMATSLMALGRTQAALSLLRATATDYPSYPHTWRALAEVAESRGD